MIDWEKLENWWATRGSLWWERVASFLARPLIAALTITVGALYLGHGIELKGAAVIFFGGLIVFVALAPPQRWKGLSERFESFKFSGFGLGLEAKRAAAQTPESEAEKPQAEAGSADEQDEDVSAGDVLALRFKFERKFAYIVKHLLNEESRDDPKAPAFATVGSLRHDGYLTNAQAELAAKIQTLRESDLKGFSAAERRKFFQEADDFVTNMRASVFDGMVRKRLGEAGWDVNDLQRAKKAARPDITVSSTQQDRPVRFVVAPTYAMKRDSEILDRSVERLGPDGDDHNRLAAAGRLVVVPNRSRVERTGTEADPAVLTLGELPDTLQVASTAAIADQPAEPSRS
jgi:hypothetical protein